MMTIDQILILARKHVGNGAVMESSARVCLHDAVLLKDDGKYIEAARRALKSLAYSVGIGHADYIKVKAAVDSHPTELQS